MRLVPVVRRLFSQSSKTPSFNSVLNEHAVRQNKVSEESLAKLDLLGGAILNLNNYELDYLKSSLAKRQIVSNPSAQLHAKVYSIRQRIGESETSNSNKIRQFFYQSQWVEEVWKETHVLSAVISEEPDQDGVKEQKEVVKEIYEFELTSVDPAQKIKVIKVLREVLALGLKEAKDFVDKAPTVFKKGKKEEGETLKTKLAAVGCVVTLK